MLFQIFSPFDARDQQPVLTLDDGVVVDLGAIAAGEIDPGAVAQPLVLLVLVIRHPVDQALLLDPAVEPLLPVVGEVVAGEVQVGRVAREDADLVAADRGAADRDFGSRRPPGWRHRQTRRDRQSRRAASVTPVRSTTMFSPRMVTSGRLEIGGRSEAIGARPDRDRAVDQHALLQGGGLSRNRAGPRRKREPRVTPGGCSTCAGGDQMPNFSGSQVRPSSPGGAM